MDELQDALTRIPEDWNGSVTWRKPVLVLRKVAWQVANPDLTMLDGYPDLYEISPKQVAALETLGVPLSKVPNAYIIGNVISGITSD